MSKFFKLLLFTIAASISCHAAFNATCVPSCAGEPVKDQYPYPVIMLEDYTNFDGFIATILLQKDPSIDFKLLVPSYGFGNVAPAVNNLYNLLAWLGNTTTQIVPGTYFTEQERLAGPNPNFAPTNRSRFGQVVQPIFNMFIPPLWKENGSTLYGQVGRIPVNTDPSRQYHSLYDDITGPPEQHTYIPAYRAMAKVLDQVRIAIQNDPKSKKAIIVNTGSHSDLAKFFKRYPGKYDDIIEKVLVMGGGFYNFNGDGEQLWAGNIFDDQMFGLTSADPIPQGYNVKPEDWAKKTDGAQFHTNQEFNIFTDPSAASFVFNYLANHKINTIVVPLDATDPVLIGNNLNYLNCDQTTPEAQLVYNILIGIKNYEGPGFPFVIRAWDVIAAMSILEPTIITKEIPHVRIFVKELDGICKLKKGNCSVKTCKDGQPVCNIKLGCNDGTNPYNVLQYDPYVGQTTLKKRQGTNITVVTEIDQCEFFDLVLSRLTNCENSAIAPMHYCPPTIELFPENPLQPPSCGIPDCRP